MKNINKIGASVFVLFCLIFSSISAVTFTINTTAIITGPPYGHIEVVKEVYDNEGWSQGPIVTNLGENLQFRITLTYHNDSGQPRLHYAYAIRVNDYLPNCLDYITDTANPTLHDYEDDPNETLYWDFGADPLFNHESKILYYNTTVVELAETPQQNNATVTWNEFCTAGTNLVNFDTLTITTSGEPGIDLVKQVKKQGDTEFVKSISANEGETLIFKINVTNTGPIDLTGVIVKDKYPEFLTPFDFTPAPISNDTINRTITWNLSTILAGHSKIIFFKATVNAVEILTTGKNIANVTCDQQLFDTDFVTITVGKDFIVDKKVWDSDKGEWVEGLDYVKRCEPVRFKINITYYGTERMKCLLVKDILPEECLNYSDNVYIEIAGEEITPEDVDYYPDIYYTPGEIFEMCFEDIILEPGEIYFSWINQSLGDGLEFGESVIIEFDTYVIRYCESTQPCKLQNCVEAWLWSCCGCEDLYYGIDCVNITCVALPGDFNKTVSALDPTNWVKEIHTVQGFTIKFKLELTYYGNENLTNVSFKDVLPCCLLYVSTTSSPPNTQINVSTDKKTIWWHVNKNITDCETVTIIFTANVVGSSECGGCINYAYVFEYLACLGCIWQGSDTATIYAHANSAPCPPDIFGPTEGVIGQELTFKAMLKDADNDQMQYKFEWEPGIDTGWLGPVSPGEVTQKHTYTTPGTKTVKVKAKDEHGAESDWTSYPLSITIKNAKVEIKFKMFNILNVGAIVNNTGEADITSIQYVFNISRDSIINFRDINVNGNGNIASLPIGESETILSDPVGLRIGKANVTATVSKTGFITPVTITGTAYLIGPIIIVIQD